MNLAYLFTSLDGRINRKPYWLAALLLFVVSIAVQAGVYFAANLQVMMIVGLIFMWPSFALAVKRAHDRNRPTWLVVLFFIILLATTFMQIAGVHESADGQATPIFTILSVLFLIFAIYAFIDWGLIPGTKGPNKYGPDPRQH